MATKVLSQDSVPALFVPTASTYAIGESFTPQTEGPFTPTSIFIYIDKVGNPADIDFNVTLFDPSFLGYYPTGPTNTAGITPGWIEYTFPFGAPTLSNGESWSLEINPYTKGDASNYWSFGYDAGNPYVFGDAYYFDDGGSHVAPGDLGFQLWVAGDPLALTPTAPLHEATGVKIAPTGLTWECTGFDAETMGFDVYFRMFGVTEFTLVGDGQAAATLVLPDNLAYNFLYFWKVNVRNLATDEILLTGDEWNFNTEALIEYPIPRIRTVPAPGGGDMTVQTAENCVRAIKHLVVASQNTLWYDYEAGT